MWREHVPLAPFTTLRIGGQARYLSEPQSEDELVADFREGRRRGLPVAVIGRGSNTIFRDEGFAGLVIVTARACTQIEVTCVKGRLFRRLVGVRAGCGVTLPALVQFCIRHRLAAPYYLASVPGNVGGGVTMNAGTGVQEGRCVSENLVAVRIFDGDSIRTLSRSECAFGFRESVFLERKWLILGAEFEYPFQTRWTSRRLVRRRMEFVRRTQDTALPNAGSVFKTGYRHDPALSGLQAGGAAFSRKSVNWIVNQGGATCDDVLRLIELAKQSHRQRGEPEPVVEIHVK